MHGGVEWSAGALFTGGFGEMAKLVVVWHIHAGNARKGWGGSRRSILGVGGGSQVAVSNGGGGCKSVQQTQQHNNEQ